MDKEIWKPVLNSEDRYKVSSRGRIKSLNYRRTGKEGIMVTPLSSRGYPSVKISSGDNKSKSRSVHQLVAESFLGHAACGYNLVVDHIDRDRTNNNLSNLRLITQRENLSKMKGGSSKYAGVSWDSTAGKWKSAAYTNKKTNHIGMFTSEKEAYKAYLKFLGLDEVVPFLYDNDVLSYKSHMIF